MLSLPKQSEPADKHADLQAVLDGTAAVWS